MANQKLPKQNQNSNVTVKSQYEIWHKHLFYFQWHPVWLKLDDILHVIFRPFPLLIWDDLVDQSRLGM